MNEVLEILLGLIGILGLVELVVLICYLFPHFSMHFFTTYAGKNMGLFLTGKCNHNNDQIKRYKKGHKNILKLLLIITVILVFALIYCYVKIYITFKSR